MGRVPIVTPGGEEVRETEIENQTTMNTPEELKLRDDTFALVLNHMAEEQHERMISLPSARMPTKWVSLKEGLSTPSTSSTTSPASPSSVRMLDYAGRKQLRVGEAVIAKMAYNATRPQLHGKLS
jgi:hypothetical protein